jgi:hypothetical protein
MIPYDNIRSSIANRIGLPSSGPDEIEAHDARCMMTVGRDLGVGDDEHGGGVV